jgi:D-Tyr-tRNAtyr deacylase
MESGVNSDRAAFMIAAQEIEDLRMVQFETNQKNKTVQRMMATILTVSQDGKTLP